MMRAPAPGRARRRRFKGETGYILVVTTMLLVPLIVFTAFGVDLGAWYAQGIKEQRAVDAASLAGVVQLPSTSNAGAAAQAALRANGYNVTCTQSTATATSAHPCTYTFPVAVSHQMTVSLWSSAQRYFSQMVIRGESLQRASTAQYDTHIPLGTPNATFGNDPYATYTQPNVYGAISGPYNDYPDGDPFATQCLGNNSYNSHTISCDRTGANPLYNSAGYEWAIQIPASLASSVVTVSIYDAGFNNKNSIGDGFAANNNDGNFTTTYQMYNATGSDADLDTSAGNKMTKTNCGSAGGTLSVTTGDTGWTPICTLSVPNKGTQLIYPLVVTNGSTGTGSNSYSLRACVLNSAGTTCKTGSGVVQPTVYAINSMSIYTPGGSSSTSSSELYLASIGTQYAGHTLEISMFDPGDGGCAPGYSSCSMVLSILKPPSGLSNAPTATPSANSIGCNYTSSGKATTSSYPAPTDQTVSSCAITTMSDGNSNYNGKWVTVDITIPTNYDTVGSCATSRPSDCWWTVYYKFNNATSTDRTTWVVDVLGNPVHLIH